MQLKDIKRGQSAKIICAVHCL